MAAISVNPIFLRDVTFTVEGDDYAAALQSVVLTPSTSVVTAKGLSAGSVFSAVPAPTWTCDISYLQDDADDAFGMYLFENTGETVTATFTPGNGRRPWTAQIILTPGAVGGGQDAFATATVSLGVKGDPTPGSLPTP